MVKESNQTSVITCRLGCINYHVTQHGDYCWGQGLLPVKPCEGKGCIRGYTTSEMAAILEEEREHDDWLRAMGIELMLA